MSCLGILSGKFGTNLRAETCLNGNLVLLEEKAPSFPDYPFAILNSLLICVPINGFATVLDLGRR